MLHDSPVMSGLGLGRMGSMQTMIVVVVMLLASTVVQADTVRMRGPSGQTIDVEERERDYYEGRGFRVLSSEEEFREASTEAARQMEERESEEQFRTWAIAIACGVLGVGALYLIRRQVMSLEVAAVEVGVERAQARRLALDVAGREHVVAGGVRARSGLRQLGVRAHAVGPADVHVDGGREARHRRVA